MITYYLSGPMRSMPEFNHPAFIAAEAALCDYLTHEINAGRWDLLAEQGFEIINPARNFDGDTTRELADYMTVDLAQVIRSDVIVLLPGWEGSEGCGREIDVAIWTGKEFMLASETDWNFWEFTPAGTPEVSPMREFATGATRDTDSGKLDYEAFLSPLVLLRYAKYMDAHRVQRDGEVRSGDNWQKGIPRDVYMKSAWRHFMDAWLLHRGCPAASGVTIDEALCALLFNIMGYLFSVESDDE